MPDLPSEATPNQSAAAIGPTVTPAEAAGLTVKLLLSLAAWYRVAGQHALAAELLAITAQRSDAQQLAQEQANLAIATGRPEQAIAILTEQTDRKDTFSGWVALGRCQLEAGNLDAAATIAADQVARSPESVTALLLAGDVARAGGNHAMARAHYETILSLVPANTNALAALGRLAVQTGDRSAAGAILEKLLTAEVPLTANQLQTVATLADLLDQPTRAAALRHQALGLEAGRAARLAHEVEVALGRSTASHVEDESPPLLATLPLLGQADRVQSAPSPAADTTSACATLPLATASAAPDEVAIDPRVTELLQRDFGYEQLRSGQAAVIANVLAGHDTLAIMPTGAGKSLTFQLPAMLLDGLTLVLSPLIALMKDQFDSLPPAVQARTALINSSQATDEQRRVVSGLTNGDYKMIYAAPERLRQHSFVSALRQAGLSLVVVDEAHCISLWGHDFRPDYLTIPAALRELDNPPVLAITATATRRMAEGIKEGFHRDLDEIRTSVFRPNLFYEAYVLANREQKVQRAIDIARQERGPGIIYVRSRKDAEAIAALLRDRGVSAAPYHAGLDSSTRSQNQDRFMSGQTRVVVATTAFGMGVNKADVRFIIHLSPTPSLEAYAQESGRAGRDGQPARCVLLATKSDKSTLSRMARRDEQGIDSLRRIYAGLKQAAVGPWALVDPDSLLRWQPLDGPDGEEEPDPRIALGLLEQAKLLKRHPDLPVAYTLHFSEPEGGESPPDPLWDALLAWLGPVRPNSPATFRTAEALAALTCPPDDLVRMLTSRPELTLREGPRQACFELLPAGTDAGARIELVLARVRQEAEGRIQQVMSYVNARRCRHVLLANHLGEGLAACGEHCDICLAVDGAAAGPVAAAAPEERSLTTADDAMAVLEAVRSLSFPLGKPGLTKFLLGSVESRVRADRSPSFGRLAGVRKGTLERLLDKLVEHGFLEFFMDREYKLLRLTEQGRRAGADDLAAFDARRGASQTSAAGTAESAASPEAEDLFNRLREWRRARAIQDAVPPYVVAHDAQLRLLAEHRPHDDSTLLDVPGFGPTKVERYGSEIVAVIAGAANGSEPVE